MRDHDHLNGKFCGAAHQDCNINANLKNYKFPVIAHNSKNYDNHFLFQELYYVNKNYTLLHLSLPLFHIQYFLLFFIKYNFFSLIDQIILYY